jgi:hypothetical protein
MKMIKNIALLLVLSIFASCASVIEGSKNEPIAPASTTTETAISDSHIVSLQEASVIAECQPYLVLKQRKSQGATQADADADDVKLSVLKRKVNRVFTLQEQFVPYLYIFNYEGGGYVVVSADERQIPVLAYSETGSVNEKAVPEGFILWAGKNKEDIQFIRQGKIAQNPFAAKEWSKLRQYVKVSPTKENASSASADCPAVTSTVGPYLSTTWGQDCGGYNTLIPLTCSGYCGFAPTGCVTTALAQVLKFWSYPSGNYNWPTMPNNFGSSEVARLMRDVASFLNTTYNCSGSGAFMSAIPGVFKNSTFLYGNADLVGHPVSTYGSYPLLLAELNNGRPVMLGGFTGTFLGLWPTGVGHTWVCDGYQRTVYLNPCSGEYAYFHMNWGWDGSYNGWYYQNDWAAGGYNFQYHKEMIVNIHP